MTVIITLLLLLLLPRVGGAQVASAMAPFDSGPVSITTTDAGTCVQNTAGCATLAMEGYTAVSAQVTGTWAGTFQFEMTVDGTTWVAVNLTPPSSTTAVTSTTANGVWTGTALGRRMRVRASVLSSGTAVVSLRATLMARQAAPPGNLGTVTSVSVTTANGVSGTVATATTTPAITLALGAITPTTVAVGSVPATAGTIRLPNNADIQARNSTNAGNVSLLMLNGSNQIAIGPANTDTLFGGGTTTVFSPNFAGGTTTTAPNGVEAYFASSSASDPRGVMSAQYSSDATGARIHLRKARGTEGTPTIITTADVLGRLRFSGYDGSSYLQMASIDAISTGTIAVTRIPTQLVFSTATDATPSVLTTAMTIGADQSVTVDHPAIAVTGTDGLVIRNATAATAGIPVQQSPDLRIRSNVWNTTATAATNTNDWVIRSVPVSGTSPTGLLKFMSSLNGAASIAAMTLTDNGTLTTTFSILATGGNISVASGGKFRSNASGANISFPADGQFNFQTNANLGFGFDGATDGIAKVRTRAQTGYSTIDALAYQASGTALTSGTTFLSSGSGMAVANVGANSCGTSTATIAGNNNASVITVGATAGTQCRVAFTIAAATEWDCTANDETTTVAVRVTPVDTTHTDVIGTFTAGDKITAICFPR